MVDVANRRRKKNVNQMLMNSKTRSKIGQEYESRQSNFDSVNRLLRIKETTEKNGEKRENNQRTNRLRNRLWACIIRVCPSFWICVYGSFRFRRGDVDHNNKTKSEQLILRFALYLSLYFIHIILKQGRSEEWDRRNIRIRTRERGREIERVCV